MKVFGNIKMNNNQLISAVVENYDGTANSEQPFPTDSKVGRLVFRIDKGQIYICTVSGETSLWKPLIKVADSYVYTQSTVSSSWSINHNLNSTNLLIQVYGGSNNRIIPNETSFDDLNNITLSFDPSTAGKAIILAIDSETTASEMTADQILNRLKTVDGSGSGLDSDMIDGFNVSTAPSPNELLALNADANLPTSITGGAESITTKIEAQENLPIYTIVTIDGYIADSANITHLNKVFGITMESVNSGLPCKVKTFGYIQNTSWNFPQGVKLFLNGTTIDTIPSSTGFVQEIGSAFNSSTLYFNLQRPIKF